MSHLYVADLATPPDPLDRKQRHPCAVCHLVGEPGDAHHTVPPPIADARSAAAGDTEPQGENR